MKTLLLLIAVVTAGTVVAVPGALPRASTAATFNPTGSACLDNETTTAACDGDSAAGAVSGITSSLNLAAGDANFSAVINFIPPEWFVANGNDIPDGARVAKLTARPTLGLLGGACDSGLQPVFNLMDATVDPSSQVTFKDGFDDANADGLPDAVTKYPDFLARMFPGQTPRARLYGQTVIASDDASLSFLIFGPGTTIRGMTPDPNLGYPTVAVLQNFGDPEIKPAPSAITDLCSPLLVGTSTYGTTQDNPSTAANEGGLLYRKNPATGGAYNLVTYVESQRDADGDGLENTLDTCPFNVDTFNPRIGSWGTAQSGDSDGDRISNPCDTSPSGAPSADVDHDSYLNAGDNCPQVTNGITSQGQVLGPNNQLDADGDGIGNACDANPASPDGAILSGSLVATVQVVGQATPSPTPSPTPSSTPTPSPLPTATPSPAAFPQLGGAPTVERPGDPVSGGVAYTLALLSFAGALLLAGGWHGWRYFRR